MHLSYYCVVRVVTTAQVELYCAVINRPVAAVAVLQTPILLFSLKLIQSVNLCKNIFMALSIRNRKS